MPFSFPPPDRKHFTDQGSEWVDALVVWLRQLQDYVNKIHFGATGGSMLELATGPTQGIIGGGQGDVTIIDTGEVRTVYNPGTTMPGVLQGALEVKCWVQDTTLVGWFC